MVQGTASGVGKSLITAALCRIFQRRGIRVAPFKAQNMSNNAGVTTSGGEVARAQVLQAAAARVAVDVRMNPVLLKPLSDRSCDVVLLGQSRLELRDTPWHERKGVLWPHVTGAFDELRAEFELVIIEGAGSPAETNLRHSDIVNMAVAQHAQSPVLLVADIDRGGAFASLYGTWALLEAGDRALIRGFLLNRFRGDASLLHPAPEELAQRTGVQTVGCVPYIRHTLPDEDAFGLANRSGGATTIAAIRLPHIANFDDLDPLAAEPQLQVKWTTEAADLSHAAAIVIPGTRNTIADLDWLWRSGLASAIRAAASRGVPVIGLCGGYQMLGRSVSDPHTIEAGGGCPGLELLPITTVLAPVKTTVAVTAQLSCSPFGGRTGSEISGYEIHHGESVVDESANVWLTVDARPVGALNGKVWGTYLHGVFDNNAFRNAFIQSLSIRTESADWIATIDRELDRLADTVEAHTDIAQIAGWAGL